MDLEVKLSPEAVEDLEGIAGYITRDSEYYARAIVQSASRLPGALVNFLYWAE